MTSHDPQVCRHQQTARGPNIPRVYGSWRSEVCLDCGQWRMMDHYNKNYSSWHAAIELADAARPRED